MATEIKVNQQSKAESRQWDVSFANDLPSGATLSSATATHTPPPGGTKVTPTVGSISGSTVPIVLSGLVDAGIHLLSVIGTYNNGTTAEVRLIIPVNF